MSFLGGTRGGSNVVGVVYSRCYWWWCVVGLGLRCLFEGGFLGSLGGPESPNLFVCEKGGGCLLPSCFRTYLHFVFERGGVVSNVVTWGVCCDVEPPEEHPQMSSRLAGGLDAAQAPGRRVACCRLNPAPCTQNRRELPGLARVGVLARSACGGRGVGGHNIQQGKVSGHNVG